MDRGIKVINAESISQNNCIWQKAEPDGNYMWELYLGQENDCLSLIRSEEAKMKQILYCR